MPLNLFQVIQMTWRKGHYIVFVWSQYDGGNIAQRQGYGCRQNQEAKLKI